MTRERSCSRGLDWNSSFPNLEDQAPRRYTWVNGRSTQVPTTTRLYSVWPEEWPRLPKKLKKKGVAAWDDEKTRLKKLAKKKRIFDVSSEETEHLSEARTKLEMCAVPSTPCKPKDECSEKPDAVPMFTRSGKPEAVNVQQKSGDRKPQKHMDHISAKGHESDFHDGMVHKSIAFQ